MTLTGQDKAQAVQRAARLLGRDDQAARQALGSLWDQAFDSGRLAAQPPAALGISAPADEFSLRRGSVPGERAKARHGWTNFTVEYTVPGSDHHTGARRARTVLPWPR